MTEENNEVVDAVLSQLEVKEAQHPTGLEMQEYVFTNDKTNPAIRNLFHMFYESVFQNKLGLMTALDPITETVVTLRGRGEHPRGGQHLPLAKILDEESRLLSLL